MQFSSPLDCPASGPSHLDRSSTRSGTIEIVVVPSIVDASEIFRLRQRAHASATNDGLHSPESFCDASDRERTTHQITVWRDRICIGAVRISLGFGARGAQGLPSSRLHPETANIARNRHKRIVEISQFAIAPEIIDLPLRASLFATLVRAAFTATLAVEATDVLIAAQTGWTPLCERLVGCVQLGKPARYPPCGDEIALLWVSMAHLKCRQARCNSFFRVPDAEVKAMRRALFGAAADLGWLPGGLHMNPPATPRPATPRHANARGAGSHRR